MAQNNFQYFDPPLTNALSDAAYTSNTQRQNGVATGDIFPSPLANKLFFQVACMSASLAMMMQNKGYDMLDTNGANLAVSLANILTNHDIAGNLVRFTDFTQGSNSNGYWEKNPSGRIMQWGHSIVAGTVTFPKPFTNISSVNVVCMPANTGSGATRNTVYLTAIGVSSFAAQTDSSSCSYYWQATGY